VVARPQFSALTDRGVKIKDRRIDGFIRSGGAIQTCRVLRALSPPNLQKAAIHVVHWAILDFTD
jgi:hypothetical protein